MQKKKIMHVVVSLANGGTEKVIYNIIKYSSSEYEHYVLALGDVDKEVKDTFKGINAKVIEQRLSFKNKRNLIDELIKVFNKLNIDVVHSHINYGNAWVLLAAKKAKVKTRISHAHSMYLSSNSIKNKINRFIQLKLIKKNSTVKLAVSEDTGRFFYKSDYIVVNNGVDVDDYFSSKEKNSDTITIGNIGRYDDNKNQLFVIDVFKELYAKNDNFRLLLCGPDGGSKQKCIEKINELGLQDVCVCDGATNDVKNVLKKIDVICFPSLSEGFSLSLLEAQIANVICVASDTVPRDVDLHLGLLEYLSLKSNQEYWASKIIEMIQNKQVYSKERIVEAINKKGFNVKDVVKTIEQYY